MFGLKKWTYGNYLIMNRKLSIFQVLADLMLPSIFTDNFCNLLKGQYRIVLCYNFYVNNDGEIVNVIIENVVAKIQNNYVYESEELLKT